MFWKKNALSYFFWLIYTVALGSILVFSSLNHVTSLPMLAGVPVYAQMLLSLLPILLVGLGCILLRRYVVRHFIHEEYGQDFWKITEALVLVAVLLIGTWLRYDSIAGRDFEAGIYSQAIVTDGGEITYLPHGASYLYMQLLRGVFLLFGNKISLAVWLQVVLFYIAGLFLYQAIRRVAGKLPALGLFVFYILAPYFRNLSVELSPLGLYLVLYCFCLFYLTEVLRNIHGKPLQYFFGGVQVAACIYLDFIGVTLIPWAILLLLMRGTWTWLVERWYLCLTTFLTGLFSGSILLCIGDAFFTKRNWFTVLKTWWMQYMPGHFEFRLEYFQEPPGVLQVLGLGMLLLTIISFWFRKKTDRLCPQIFILAVLILPELFSMSSGSMSYGPWIILQFVLVCMISFFELFDLTDRAYMLAHQPPVPIIEAEMTITDNPAPKEGQTDVWKPEQYEHMQVSKKHEKNMNTVSEEPSVSTPAKPQKKVQFLENPLPVPKRHGRRVMDYPLTDISADDDYDIQIAEDDDYDY